MYVIPVVGELDLKMVGVFVRLGGNLGAVEILSNLTQCPPS